MDFYFNSICHECKKFKVDLKRCSSCRFIAYCSKEHQVSNWKKHRQICNAIADYNKSVKLEENCGYDQWRSYRTGLQFYLKQRLKRELLPFESQMWMFPRNCAVCYSAKGLTDCQGCLSVAYCSQKHKTLDNKIHKHFCSELKLSLDLDNFYSTNPKVAVQMNKINGNVYNLPSNIQESTEMFLNIQNLSFPLERIFLADSFGSILTIFYGLEKCKLLVKRNLATGNLIIHLVGADISELILNWNYNIQLIESWIKNLKLCKLILIGPECKWDPSYEVHSSDRVKIECICDFYHNVEGKLDHPDIIIALNSGLHEFELSTVHDTWSKSLPTLMSSSAPLLLTAYTESELERDLNRLSAFELKRILKIQKNPFANLRPIRDWDSKNNIPFYVNGYITIIAGDKYPI